MNDDVYIIVPLYNEANIIRDTVGKLLEQYKNIVVIDDGSTDGSADTIADTGAIILRHAVNLGQGAAIQTGMNFTLSKSPQYVVTFDADGQHQVEDIERLLSALKDGCYDVALGSRFLGKAVNIPFTRKLMIKFAVLINRYVNGYRFTDTHNGLRAFTLAAAGKIHITQNRMAHASQILKQIYDQQIKYTEVPITVSYSKYSVHKGQTNLNALNILSELIEEKLFK